MACLVSISFSTPLRTSPPILLKEIHPKKLSLGGLSSKATFRTALKLFASCSSNKGILSVNQNQSCQHLLMTPSRCLYETVTCQLNVDSSTPMVITGYWIGPDIDDGWGFVEAFVNQTT